LVLPEKIEDEEVSLDPPVYMKFTYRDEWRHIPEKEVFPIWTTYDFKLAVYAFREIHQSQGALTVFATEDLIDWKIWGEVSVE
jgi:hypothetical protein